jgi:hypothetical protein
MNARSRINKKILEVSNNYRVFDCKRMALRSVSNVAIIKSFNATVANIKLQLLIYF